MIDKTKPVIRMDRSKSYSTVHGDRTPQDPAYRVHFWQNGLPFDVSGVLVADDGKKDAWTSMVDGDSVQFHPLYSDKMRDVVRKRIERMDKGGVLAQAVEDDESADGVSSRQQVEDALDDVNLESWLRGEVSYQPNMLFAAYRKRFSRAHQKLQSLLEDAIYDEKIVPEAEVAPHLLKIANGNTSVQIAA